MECHRQPHHRTLQAHGDSCCPTARCSWQQERVSAALLPAQNCTDPASGTWSATGQPHHRTLPSHGDVVAQRQCAGGSGAGTFGLAARNCSDSNSNVYTYARTNVDSNGYGDRNSDVNAYCHCNGYSNSDSYCNVYPDSYGNSYSDPDSHTNVNANTYTHADSNPNTSLCLRRFSNRSIPMGRACSTLDAGLFR